MGIFNNLFKKKEVRSEGVEYVNPNLYSNVISFSTGLYNSNSMNLSAVYRATEIISDSCAILPIEVLNKDNKEVNNNLSLIFKQHYNLIKLLIQSVLIKGNGFAYIYRSADGTPIRLRFLQSNDVQIVYKKEKDELYYNCPIISNKKIEQKDMIHLVKNSWDGVNGVSVISYASKTIQIAAETEKSASNYFSNGGHLSGILCAEGNTTVEQRNEAKNAFINNLKAGDISVLPKEFKYQAIQMNVEDAQLLQSRLYNVQDIARFFGISPVLLGDLSHNSLNTIEAVQQQFLIQTLQPYISMIEDEFNRKLGTQDIKINLNENYILRTDKAGQANYYSTLVTNGILTVNEVRSELGYSEIEGGDKAIVAFSKITDNQINQNETAKEE